MKSKHTPGPWQPVRSATCGHLRAGHNMNSAHPAKEWTAADMRLIAAAPDLLAACKQVLDASEDNGDMEDIDWNGLRAAIARAEGGEA